MAPVPEPRTDRFLHNLQLPVNYTPDPGGPDVAGGYPEIGGIRGQRSELFGMTGRAHPNMHASAYKSFSAPE